MRSVGVLLLLIQLFFSPLLLAQPRDTVITLTDSTREATRQTVKKEFERWKDSVQAERIKQNVQKNGKPLDVFLQEMREKERAEKRRKWVRIGAGTLLLFGLFVAIARRANKRRSRR